MKIDFTAWPNKSDSFNFSEFNIETKKRVVIDRATYSLTGKKGVFPTIKGAGLKSIEKLLDKNGNGVLDVKTNKPMNTIIRKFDFSATEENGEVSYFVGVMYENQRKVNPTQADLDNPNFDKWPNMIGTCKKNGDDTEYQLSGYSDKTKPTVERPDPIPYISIRLAEKYVPAN